MPQSTEPSVAEKSLRARIAAHSKWSTADAVAGTAAARAASPAGLSYHESLVDPDRVLPEDERARRALSSRKAYYARLALRSAQARRAKRTPVESDTGV
jgi:hypothetical protein